MPALIKKYKIFIASPSDLLDERAAISEVIKELNITYGAYKGIILELIKWESHSAPGINQVNTQDIISHDIGNDYDLFIGILWTKFGTPTSNASSGTEEEFMLAYQRYMESPNSLQILFYFKNSSPTSLDDINPLELHKVQEFRSSLESKNVLYWRYGTISDFQSFLRLHIPKRIDELEKNNKNPKEILEVLVLKQDNSDFEELGIIDYQDDLESSLANSVEALSRITESLEWIGIKINEKTAELEKMKKKKKDLGNKELRNYFQRTATIMNDFASRIDPEIPFFIKNFEDGVHSISQLINISENDCNDDVINTYNAIILLSNEILGSTEGMASFLREVSILPRMEKELNKSRNNVESKLSHLIEQMNISHTIIEELKKQFVEKYGF